MTKEKTAPLGHGVDKEDGINGSLEEAILGAKGVSGVSDENEAILKNTLRKETQWGKNGPSVEGQFQDETAWRKKKTYIKVYDLSIEEQLDAYSNLINAAHQEDPEAILIDEEKQFCRTTENWKVLVQVVEIEYKQTL